ncbi:MAG: phosphoserine transaminase [Ignavibacteria bacterium GWF2_33_9]|nr:MAG: phosphoserine transaminase [Ignavibacteria bacterium GWF2_33_9]
MERAYNFSAGPAVLPMEVLEATAQASLNFNGLGMSIMEMSHRSKEYDVVIKEAQADALKIMNLSADEYEVLFLGGGASTQFLMIPYNFLKTQADYLHTGVWAGKAIKEAEKIGKVNVIASSKDTTFNYIPKDFVITPDADYVHITTNNTIYGTEFRKDLEVGNVPFFADMSSDMFAVQRDFSKYDLIYAGAQKNIGPAGVTLVVIKKSLMERQRKVENMFTMLDYNTHLNNESMFNTPPCLPIYVVGQTFKWILKNGLDAIEANNIKKAAVLYDFMDASNGYYAPTVKNHEDRSLMNVCFNLATPELEAKFIADAKAAYNMTNLKGHRSVGGVRASIYNAAPIEWVETLVKFMEKFQKEN